jgi:succinate dehydrogenase / fumarate reductase iron-sulfur subunit
MHRVFSVSKRLPCAPRSPAENRIRRPADFVRLAGLEMHPLDDEDRSELIKTEMGIGYCNITKCCTEVCPESIAITDNAIIPLKERIVDRYYYPVMWLWRKVTGKK